MFRTVSVHLREQLFISCMSYLVYADTSGCSVTIATQQPDVWYRHIPAYNGICRYMPVYDDTSGCSLAIATQQPDVSAYTGIYRMRHTAYKKLLLKMD